ncbi:MAG TPA: glycosyltransferase family A protein [Allosphingosinicella sp.]
MAHPLPLEPQADRQARVTVAIPAYKAEATIRRAVDSVLAQQGVDLEVVVVVDGIFDRTVERLEGYPPSVRVLVNERNSGAQVARNRGLVEATGEYVLFLDCDDYLEDQMLAPLVARMRERDAELGFAPMQVLKEATGKRRPAIFPAYDSADDIFRLWMGHGRVVAPCSLMWRTDFLREIGGWDERVFRAEDREVVIRSIMRGARFAVSDQGRGIYVNHDSPDRLTRRPEILQSSIDVGEIVLATDTEFVSERVKREGLAGYFYRIGLLLQSLGRPDLAAHALRRARELGRVGPFWHRAAATALGLPFRTRLLKMHQTGRPVWFLLALSSLLVRRANAGFAQR